MDKILQKLNDAFPLENLTTNTALDFVVDNDINVAYYTDNVGEPKIAKAVAQPYSYKCAMAMNYLLCTRYDSLESMLVFFGRDRKWYEMLMKGITIPSKEVATILINDCKVLPSFLYEENTKITKS